VNYLEKNPGIDGYDIMISIFKPPLENWGVRGGIHASRVEFGFKIDV
jgi:hypothetical protein